METLLYLILFVLILIFFMLWHISGRLKDNSISENLEQIEAKFVEVTNELGEKLDLIADHTDVEARERRRARFNP